MSLYFRIKKAFPDIKDEEMELRDDGTGAYITDWTYAAAPMPDLASLPSVTPAEIMNLQKTGLRGNIRATIARDPILDALLDELIPLKAAAEGIPVGLARAQFLAALDAKT